MESAESGKLKKSGLKNTKHRADILKVLEGHTSPVTAEDIFLTLKENGKQISFSTVYRILEVLVEKDLALKISSEGSESALFELNRSIHRHYLVCLGCHKMLPIDDCPIEDFEKELTGKTGFEVTGHNLEIYGYCRECRKQK